MRMRILVNLKICVFSDGRGFQVDIKKLASKCKNVDNDIHVLVHKEFRGGFTQCASLTNSDGLLLRTFTMQPIDSTIVNAMHTCHVTLGHKIKTTY